MFPLTNGPQGTSRTSKLDMALISLKNTNFKVKPNENVFQVGKELGDCLIYPHALHPLLFPVTPATRTTSQVKKREVKLKEDEVVAGPKRATAPDHLSASLQVCPEALMVCPQV